VKDRIRHVWDPYTNEHGDLKWPSGADERNSLASRLIGAITVVALDGSMDWAAELLRVPSPSPEWRRSHTNWESYEAARNVFATLTTEQREWIERLVAHAAFGVMFSFLVHLDQFPGGWADIAIADPENENQQIASAVNGDTLDLHDRLGGWIEEFSEYTSTFEDPITRIPPGYPGGPPVK
jgi:hypothetical protein